MMHDLDLQTLAEKVRNPPPEVIALEGRLVEAINTSPAPEKGVGVDGLGWRFFLHHWSSLDLGRTRLPYAWLLTYRMQGDLNYGSVEGEGLVLAQVKAVLAEDTSAKRMATILSGNRHTNHLFWSSLRPYSAMELRRFTHGLLVTGTIGAANPWPNDPIPQPLPGRPPAR